MTIERPVLRVESNSAACRETFEALISPHLQLLRRWIEYRVRDRSDAEDVMQQTLFLAFRHVEQFRFGASFGTWLVKIALNVIRGRGRRTDRSRVVAYDPQTMENFLFSILAESPLAALERSELDLHLRRAVAQLPEASRGVVELRDFRSLSIEETARSLRLSPGAIKSRHRRARLMLQKLLS